MKDIGLYIHVPFCVRKCPYCDFYSVPADNLIIGKYIKKTKELIKTFGKKLKRQADTVYFGGGTPETLGNDGIIGILRAVRKAFPHENPEITLEINPANRHVVDFERIRFEGVNRLSIGAQSANDIELKALGRKHSSNDIFETVDKARKCGFSNISLDLMLAVQHQSIISLANTIDAYCESGVPHISSYLLKIEKGTKYFENKETLILPGEDLESELYMLACRKLREKGYSHYEISNFSFKGFESKHNLKYWQFGEYLGIGPSAHSFINGKRFFYPASLKKFTEDPRACPDGIGVTQEEFVMLSLRLARGLKKSEYKKRFGIEIPEEYYKRTEIYQKNGYMVCDSEGFHLTECGFLISNRIILDIIR